MKVWLCVPPRPREQVLNLLPPFGLGYLAAACRRAGHAVAIIDCALEGLSPQGLAERVAAEAPGVVGFGMFSTDVPAVYACARHLKALPQPPLVIAGGIHPSSYPQPTLQACAELDALFCGEAEESLPAWLAAIEQGHASASGLARIPGLVMRSGSGLQVSPPANPLDLDALGMPAWDLLSPLRYQEYPPTLFVRQRPFAPIITTRGCPYLCTYCAGHKVSGRKIRSRSLGLVFAEIEHLQKTYGIREIHIEDDNFTWDRGRVAAFCEGLLARGGGLTWTMPNGVRLDTLDAELLKLMRRAGCYFLILGVESGSDRVLTHMRKKITVAQVEEKTRLVHEAGILAHAFFMLGYPTELEEDIESTLSLALRLPLIGAHFSSFRPLPGTAISDALTERGEVQAFDFSADQGTFASVVYAPPGMTRERIKRWQRRMLLAFYLRPRVLWRYLLEMLRHPALAVNVARKAWLYLKGRE